MPFVETTMIRGYDAGLKARLAAALTRAVRSVMDAPPDAVIVVFRELEPGNWVRGGVARAPGPPLPDAVAAAALYLAGAPSSGAMLAEDCAPPELPAGVAWDSFDEALTDDGSRVFAQGRAADGGRFLVRLHMRAGRIVDIGLWRAAT